MAHRLAAFACAKAQATRRLGKNVSTRSGVRGEFASKTVRVSNVQLHFAQRH